MSIDTEEDAKAALETALEAARAAAWSVVAATKAKAASGEAAAQGAVKRDVGKPRMDLLPPRALLAVGSVMAYGATTYGAHNWRLGLAWGRLCAAALRHTMAWISGEQEDEESGLPHLAHAAASLLMLLESAMEGYGSDDRWRSGE